MKSNKHRRDHLKHLGLALAAATGLATGSAHALTTTSVIDLGAYNSGGTTFSGGDLVSKIPLGSLPAGSILRSVAMNYRLEAGDPYLGDLRVLFADATGDNGVLQIAGNPNDGGYSKTASTTVNWSSGSDYSVGVTATQTLTSADGIPAIDLNTTEVWLHTGYPGSWAGSVTLEYDVPEPALIMSFGPGAAIGTLVSNSADIAWTVPFGTNVSTLAPTFTLSSGTCDKDNGGPTTYDFTNPVIYTVTDGATVNNYTVTVTVAPDEATLLWNVVNGIWDFSTSNWKGQTSGLSTVFFNGKNVIFNGASGGTVTIASSVAPLTTTVSDGNYTFTGQPITAGSLVKDGSGTLKIQIPNNSYTGGTVINAGQLRMDLQADAALGTGPVTLNGGTLFMERITASNALIVNGGTLLASNGFGDAWNGTVMLNSNLIVSGDGNSGDMAFNGAIGGVGGLTFNGPNNNALRPILAVANSYTGSTSVTDCTLRCDHVDALGSGPLSISSTVNSKVNLNYVGTKTVASLTLGGAAQTTPGTYGSVASGANFQDDNYFTAGSTGTVTIGSSYDIWSGGAAFGVDTNNDGVLNGMAWVLGAANKDANAVGLRPLQDNTTDPTYFIFTYRRADAASTDPNTTIAVEYGSSLGSWITATAGPNVIITPTDNFYGTGPGVDKVEVKINRSLAVGGKLFVRLKVVKAP